MHVEIPSFEVDLKFQRIRGSEGPDVEIPSCEVDLRLFQVDKAEKFDFDPRPPSKRSTTLNLSS